MINAFDVKSRVIEVIPRLKKGFSFRITQDYSGLKPLGLRSEAKRF
jgi:hypothetical protein